MSYKTFNLNLNLRTSSKEENQVQKRDIDICKPHKINAYFEITQTTYNRDSCFIHNSLFPLYSIVDRHSHIG